MQKVMFDSNAYRALLKLNDWQAFLSKAREKYELPLMKSDFFRNVNT